MRILSEPPREQGARTKRLRPILGSVLGAHSSSEARLNSSSWFPSLAVLECLLAPRSHQRPESGVDEGIFCRKMGGWRKKKKKEKKRKEKRKKKKRKHMRK